MKAISTPTVATATVFVTAASLAWQARAGRDLVGFPEIHAEGVHYATVK